MVYEYIRFCHRASDGKQFKELCSITGEQVAMQRGGGGGSRLEFLELLNSWNRNGTLSGQYFYCYFAA